MITDKNAKWLAIDQYGHKEIIQGRYPRKALLEKLGRKHCAKMYQDPDAKHIGYIVAGSWFSLYRVFGIDEKYARMG